ncbi:uncharacterized protein EKO05_0008631 [Ascochyta rabiei]|uniref:uncharacterized protein n=1 Tax=Didymella rabiei TaxID=5454 RepID=UPI00220557B5|nr:uncharacterized protein EKO05_0008631 [Ascochyta rabiei]UPX18329.1 hypothetical protein EKO05_0008631 [Ascochyta rabiei]
MRRCADTPMCRWGRTLRTSSTDTQHSADMPPPTRTCMHLAHSRSPHATVDAFYSSAFLLVCFGIPNRDRQPRRKLHPRNFDRRPLPAPTQTLRRCGHRGPDLTIRNWSQPLHFRLAVNEFSSPSPCFTRRALAGCAFSCRAMCCILLRQSFSNRASDPVRRCQRASQRCRGRASIRSRHRTPQCLQHIQDASLGVDP